MSNTEHNPDPEFVSRLEWQLQSEYRRRQRFDEQNATPRRWNGWLRTAALVVISLFAGVAGVTAAQHFENSWRKELLLARSEASAELAKIRLQVSMEMRDAVAKQFEAGLSEREDAAYAEMQVKQAQFQVKRTEIDWDEIHISGNPPRQELSAPLLQGRDFVSERLQLELQEIGEHSNLVRQEMERALERRQAGRADSIEVAHVEQELKRLEQQADSLRRNLKLRQAFLNGELTARQVELQEMLIHAQTRSLMARSRLDAVRREMEYARERFEAGAATELDMRQVEFQAKAAQTEARLAEMEVRLLERALEE